MSAALWSGLLAGYGIALPVGAVAAYLVALSARTSLRAGAAAAMGVATTDGAYALAAVLGGSALGDAVAPYARALRLVSAAVLVAVALQVVRAAVRTPRPAAAEPAPLRPARAYVVLLGLTAVNPATVAYFAALVVGLRTSWTAGPGAAFVVAAFVASASWQLLLVGGGALLGRVLTGPRGRLVTGLVSGAVVLGLAARLAGTA